MVNITAIGGSSFSPIFSSTDLKASPIVIDIAASLAKIVLHFKFADSAARAILTGPKNVRILDEMQVDFDLPLTATSIKFDLVVIGVFKDLIVPIEFARPAATASVTPTPTVVPSSPIPPASPTPAAKASASATPSATATPAPSGSSTPVPSSDAKASTDPKASVAPVPVTADNKRFLLLLLVVAGVVFTAYLVHKRRTANAGTTAPSEYNIERGNGDDWL